MKIIQTSEFELLRKWAQKMRQTDIKKMWEWRATQAAPTVPVQVPAAPKGGRGGKGPAVAPQPTPPGNISQGPQVGQPGPAPEGNPALTEPVDTTPPSEESPQTRQMEMLNRQMALINTNNIETPQEVAKAEETSQKMDAMAKLLDQKAKNKQQPQMQQTGY